tara:strand:- start:4159 stop:6780 length:2622 start_codon:yes stop_codon:yes gene_type:complete
MGVLNDLKSVVKTKLGDKAVSKEQGSEKPGDNPFFQTNLPWGRQESPYFGPIELDPRRADGIYPYRLLVIDVKDGNKIVNSSGTDDAEVVKYKSNTGGVQYKIGSPTISWKFTLPITPQQLSITDQFAINTSATMRGIVEEHNGVKFKMISASGTTGIWPTRDQLEDPVPTIPALGGFATGISAAFESAKSSFNKLVDGGNPPPIAPDYLKDGFGTKTGYFQASLLQQFLEQYAMAKTKPENKHWRLVFDCPKTNESFIVTPITFTTTKTQRSPGESLFNMQFKAWKRVRLNSSFTLVKSDIQPIDTNFLQKLNNALDNARSFMGASTNVIKAVRADFRRPFDTLRKVTLLTKDIAGFVFTVSDLPSQIGKDISAATKKRSADLAASETLFEASFGSGQANNTSTSQAKIRAAVFAIKSNSDKNEGLSDKAVEDGQLGVEARDANRASPVNEIFNNPEENFDFNAGMSLNDLDLTPKQQAAIEDEIELNSLLSIEEVKDFTAEIQELILDLSNNFGAGDTFFSEIYGRPAPKERAVPMTLQEFELITALEEAVLQMHILTATRDLDDQRGQSPLEYVGGLADDSGITFNSTSTAKILSPVPFGLTIQQISARYLGDPDRYNEIITLNNLRSPYIDEDGFFYTLLTNGDGRNFTIDSDKNLYIDQKIQLSSNTVPLFTRKISAIEKITDSNYLITVDGVDNLSSLTTVDNAKIRAFLPGTTNSQNQIYIPSDEAISDEPRTFDIPHLEGDTLTGLSKIDWLLQDSGDVVVNSFGEVNLSNGITNLIQALKMKIVTQKGTLLSNAEFGLGIKVGVNVSDITIETVLKELRSLIVQDPRFEDVDSIEMNILPPEVSISITARLANGRGVFPINFTV